MEFARSDLLKDCSSIKSWRKYEIIWQFYLSPQHRGYYFHWVQIT